MNIPYYWFSIPKYKLHNRKLRKTKSFPHYLITPISLSIMKGGDMEMKDGQLFLNFNVKTITLFDIGRRIKRIFRRTK